MDEQILRNEIHSVNQCLVVYQPAFDEKVKVPKPLKAMATAVNEVYQLLDETTIKVGVESRLMANALWISNKICDQSEYYEMRFVSEERRNVSSAFDNLVDIHTDSRVRWLVNQNTAIFRREWSPTADNNVIKGNLNLQSNLYDFENQILAYVVTPLYSLIGKPENGTTRLINLRAKGNAIKPGDEYVFWYHVMRIPKIDINRMYSTSVKMRLSFESQVDGTLQLKMSIDDVERQMDFDRSEPVQDNVQDLDYEEPEFEHEH